MDITIAREIIKRAKKDDIYDGPMPEDDDVAVTEAQNLVQQAEQAWAKHIRGPEVEAILKMAAAGENGSEPSAEEGDEHAPPETEGEQTPTIQSGEARLGKIEPWEGYADSPVKDITEGINYFAEEDPDSILEVLRHVWQFETAHKNRARILTHASEIYERFGGTVESEEGQAAEGESEAGAVEEAPDTEASGEFDGEDDEGASDEGIPPDEQAEPEAVDDADGGVDAEPETSSARGQRRHSEAKSSQEDPAGGSKGGGGPSAYEKLVGAAETELRRERLDVPKPPEEKAPELPWNWNDISDGELRELHMRFSVCSYYKQYRLALHERIALHCKDAADALHNERMVSISKYDEKGKEKKVGLIEAEIASDAHVKRWRVLQRKHEQLAAASKRELEGYNKLVESLSRLETMRHNAWERARR